jgi:hypothetical protein
MNENNAEIPLPESSGAESPVAENPVEPAAPALQTPEKPKGRISKAVWIAGCGALLLTCAAFIVAFVYFGLPLLQGDPIVSVVPNDSMMYMGVDLAQTQSEQFGDIVAIVQEMADEDKDKTLAETLDKLMKDELDMSFSEDVMPWVGRYGALVITEGDFTRGEVKLMFILETRSKGKTDEFLPKFVEALEKKQDMQFVQSEKDGITFYVAEANSTYEEDMVLARNGKFVYLSNSQETILASASLQKKDSLGSLQSYKDALAALPKKRLTTVYLGGDILSQAFEDMFSQAYGLSYSSYMQDLVSEGLTGMAMSLSMEEQGLRMDAASVFDETKLNDYQKEVFATKYLAPTTAALFPEDTFLFVGTNSSQSPGSYTKVDNPLYSGDVQESFDLLEQQYGINVQDFVNLLGGEFAFGLGPAQDGLLAQAGNVSLGFTLLAGTNNESGFIDWFENVLDTLFSQNMVQYDTRETKIGDYNLKELSIQNGPESLAALIYGADNGYIVLGTSPSMLESGLSGDKTLANSEAYRRTWAAFPPESVPYMYLNLENLMNFLVKNSDQFGGSELRDAQKKLQKIPVIALSVNNETGPVRSVIMIIFIDKNKQLDNPPSGGSG